MIASLMTAILLLTAGYIVDGFVVEPVRLGAIYLVMVAPITFLVAIPFLLLGPRKFGENRCEKCGYDITGNESGWCPECGIRVGSEPGEEPGTRFSEVKTGTTESAGTGTPRPQPCEQGGEDQQVADEGRKERDAGQSGE